MSQFNQEKPVVHVLMVFLGGEPKRFILDESVVTLGRRRENLIQVIHQCVSACHLVLNRNDDGSFRLMDVGSSNGTTVNGVPVSSSSLSDGDRIVVGKAVKIHYLVLPYEKGINGLPAIPIIRGQDMKDFHSLTERIDVLNSEVRSLHEEIESKTLEYQQLIESIVEAKASHQRGGLGLQGNPNGFSSRFGEEESASEEEAVLPA